MADAADTRVAVYIDFDNIVISRYNQLYGPRQFTNDRARSRSSVGDDQVSGRVRQATVDVGAILDYASSFGSIAISRAYADWSATVNAGYRTQLVDRAVDLVQLFPTVQSMKNGADIRLAVDVVEDLFRLSDLTHVVIVAGDSDYIALAQRCRLLGRYVVGIGVAGATSKSLAAACDEFASYDALPGIDPIESEPEPATRGGRTPRVEVPVPAASVSEAPVELPAPPAEVAPVVELPDRQEAGTSLLLRALRLGRAKNDSEWLATGGVKSQMMRMDPSFQESALGFGSFSDFVRSRADVVDFDNGGPNNSPRIKLRPPKSSGRRARSAGGPPATAEPTHS